MVDHDDSLGTKGFVKKMSTTEVASSANFLYIQFLEECAKNYLYFVTVDVVHPLS